MRKTSLFINLYAILLLIGGIIGYLSAHSIMSLLVSVMAASALAICSFFVCKNSNIAYNASIVIVVGLCVFFAYRFFLSFKFMPGAGMAIISAALIAYLIASKYPATKK